jgi:hypothetical protein
MRCDIDRGVAAGENDKAHYRVNGQPCSIEVTLNSRQAKKDPA